MFRRAGVHLYRASPGMTGVVGPYLIAHGAAAGPETPSGSPAGHVEAFSWPAPCRTVVRLVPYRPLPIHVRNDGTWVDTLPGGTTAVYRCE